MKPCNFFQMMSGKTDALHMHITSMLLHTGATDISAVYEDHKTCSNEQQKCLFLPAAKPRSTVVMVRVVHLHYTKFAIIM